MPTDSRTANRNYKKPSTANTVAEDFARHIDAMDAIDADVAVLYTGMAGKAETVHTHTIAQVTGLQTALDGKQNSGSTSALDDLTDVNAPAPANNQVLKRIGNIWAPGSVASSEVTGLDAAIDAKINALVAGAPAALDTLDELAAAIGDNTNYAASVTASLGNRLRVDAAQGLTAPQQAQARDNLGLGTMATQATGAFVSVSTGGTVVGVVRLAEGDNGGGLIFQNGAASNSGYIEFYKSNVRLGYFGYADAISFNLVTEQGRGLSISSPWARLNGRNIQVGVQSPQFMAASSGLVQWAHGLGVEPLNVQVYYVCTVAGNGYAVGDRILATSFANNGNSGPSMAVKKSATLVEIKFCLNALEGPRWTDGATILVGFANFQVIITATV
jgi:hypothetical protein